MVGFDFFQLFIEILLESHKTASFLQFEIEMKSKMSHSKFKWCASRAYESSINSNFEADVLEI